jgi:hypothetical protein
VTELRQGCSDAIRRNDAGAQEPGAAAGIDNGGSQAARRTPTVKNQIEARPKRPLH